MEAECHRGRMAGGEPMLAGESGGTPAPRRNGWPQVPGLRRERLLERLRVSARLTLVLAPAGCGKTTLLAQYSDERYSGQAAGPIVWHRSDRLDADPAHFTAKLARELLDGGVLREDASAQGGFERFLDMVRAARPGPVTLVVDDAHLLLGSPTESCVEQLLCHVPEVSVSSPRAAHRS